MISLPCSKPELFKYTPHQGRMLLLDRIDAVDQDSISLTSSTFIKEVCEFFDPVMKNVPIWTSFEYMAQSIAALSGITAHIENKGEPKAGFIMAVRTFKGIEPYFSVGDTVVTRVTQSFRDEQVAVFEGCSSVNGKVYSHGTLSVIESSPELMNRWNK